MLNERGMKTLRERKYLALLTVLIVAAVLEPLAADWSERSRTYGGVIVAVLALGVLLAVFEQRWERWSALFLVTPILASNIAHQALSGWAQVAAIVYHGFGVMFFGFAVAVILKRIFQGAAAGGDPVIGALCGYLLAAAAWANAYGLVYLLWPGSFRVADAIAWKLGDWNLQRFLFNYFSITTLTSLGYGDITPIGPLALSLSWLEVVFGQFYIAIVVAQLVGLRLAHEIKRDRSG